MRRIGARLALATLVLTTLFTVNAPAAHAAYTKEDVTPTSMAFNLGTPVSTGGGCWTASDTVIYKNIFTITLIKFKQTQNWCGSGGKITSRSYSINVYTNLGWKYNGVVNKQTTGGAGQTWTYGYRQGEFQNCQLGVCLYKYPWVKEWGYPNGTWAHNEGG